jgi:hypothetical protein
MALDRTIAPRRALACALLAALAAAGCGYAVGPTAGTADRGDRTIAVPVFDNDTYRRGFEVEMTRALVNEIHARSMLRVVPDPAAADLVVRGRIRSFRERVLADRGRDTITENSVEVTLVVVVENPAAGTRRSLTFSTREPYSTFKGQRLATARAEAFENLAEEIVFALESSWPDPTESS